MVGISALIMKTSIFLALPILSEYRPEYSWVYEGSADP